MAGIFGLFDYSKPGPGVRKDEPEKPPFIRFFIILFRKFFRILELNLIYFTLTMPLFTFFLTLLMSALKFETGDNRYLSVIYSTVLSVTSSWPTPLLILLVIVSAILYGPANAGMAYILRNFSREEHAYVWSDFWDTAKSNFKQSLIVGLFDITAAASALLYLSNDIQYGTDMLNNAMFIAKTLAFPLGFVYILMRFYIFTLIVSFDMPLKNIVKNSLIFTVVGLWRNLLVFVIILASLFVTSLLDIAFFPFFTFAFIGYAVVFITWPVIKKYMIDSKQSPEENQDISSL